MKTKIFPGATENENAIFAFLLVSLVNCGADSAEMFGSAVISATVAFSATVALV